MPKANFSSVLKQLNDAQKDAVMSLEGPVMVVAGPGTGKTQVLAARIANILEKTDTPPYAILALTFTESAAINMRERVVSMIGKPGYYVNITTFHSFCSEVIKTHPEYFPIQRGSEALSDLEKFDMFERIIHDLDLKALKPLNRTLFYMRDIIQSISHLKREGFMPGDFKKIVKKEYSKIDSKLSKTQKMRLVKQKEKNEELARIYIEYNKRLRKRLRFDFDDMIALTVEAFTKNELLLREYQEKLLYFLIDEYQDTNSAQNLVVELLASYWGDKANLFAVGDPNQSIYRFQGASVENTLGFANRYPEAKVVHLKKVYRCSQMICDAAHDVILNNKLTESEFESQGLESATQGSKINISELPSQTVEILYVTDVIKKLLKKGVDPENIAILYRHNADAADIQKALEKWGILYEIDGGENILEAEAIRQLIQFLKVIHDIKSGQEDEKLFEILSYDWTDINGMLAMKIARAAGKAKISIADLIQAGYDTFIKYHKTDEVTQIEFHTAEIFLKQLMQWSNDDAKMVFTAWFESILEESGYIDWILENEAKAELLTNLNSLYREIKALVNDSHGLKLKDFLQAIDTMQENKINIYAEDLNIKSGAVHLSTVHKAKGREWEYVFIIHNYDGKWGNTRKRELIPLPDGLLKNTDLSKKERNEDERRLFYVALTRAKKQVHITYPQTMISAHRSREVVSSMFIEEISPSRLSIKKNINIAEKAVEHIEHLLRPQKESIIKVTDEEYFARLVKDFKLSVTALNTYLRDTDEFIKNILLRVPRAKPAPMAFGTAVHYALEQMYKNRSIGENFSKKDLLTIFETSLKNELLDIEEFKKRLTHGKEILDQYYDTYDKEVIEPLFIERFFGFGFSKTVLGDIHLTGRIDRVDWIDKNKKTVRVIDYKTGRSRTANEIEGKTASSHLSEREQSLPENIRGPYKRQLLFYKLLTELDQTFIPQVTEGMFDFIEPKKDSGKFVQRRVLLENSDVQELKKLITEVMAEIRSLKFLKN